MKADKFLNDSGGECPLLQNSAVFARARQDAQDELIKKNNYPGDTISSIISMMDDMPCIREISTIPFYVYYWTDNQILLWKEAAELGFFISIDASGSFVKVPTIIDDNKSSDIFLYNIVIHLENKIFTLCQGLSATHTTQAIYSWIFAWLQSGAPVPQEVVVDCSSTLLNAVSLAFNGIYFNDYLEKCFSIVNEKVDVLPCCLIKRDRAHLIKNICKLKQFEKENWIKKDFYVRSIGYCLHLEDMKLFEDTIMALFIVCESEFCDVSTECYKRKKWLMEKISTFNFESYYGSTNTENEDAKNTMEENFESYIKLESEVENVYKITDYIHNIYNKSIKIVGSMTNNTLSIPNNYFLPSLCNYLIDLFIQFPAWTNIMNKYCHSKNTVSTSSASECYYRILRKDYQMNCCVSVDRFILNHLDYINGATKLGRTIAKKLKNKNLMNSSSKNNEIITQANSQKLILKKKNSKY